MQVEQLHAEQTNKQSSQVDQPVVEEDPEEVEAADKRVEEQRDSCSF